MQSTDTTLMQDTSQAISALHFAELFMLGVALGLAQPLATSI